MSLEFWKIRYWLANVAFEQPERLSLRLLGRRSGFTVIHASVQAPPSNN